MSQHPEYLLSSLSNPISGSEVLDTLSDRAPHRLIDLERGLGDLIRRCIAGEAFKMAEYLSDLQRNLVLIRSQARKMDVILESHGLDPIPNLTRPEKP